MNCLLYLIINTGGFGSIKSASHWTCVCWWKLWAMWDTTHQKTKTHTVKIRWHWGGIGEKDAWPRDNAWGGGKAGNLKKIIYTKLLRGEMKSGLQDRRSADTLFLAKPRDRQETRFMDSFCGRGVDFSRKSALKKITGFEERRNRDFYRMIICGGILLPIQTLVKKQGEEARSFASYKSLEISTTLSKNPSQCGKELLWYCCAVWLGS